MQQEPRPPGRLPACTAITTLRHSRPRDELPVAAWLQWLRPAAVVGRLSLAMVCSCTITAMAAYGPGRQ